MRDPMLAFFVKGFALTMLRNRRAQSNQFQDSFDKLLSMGIRSIKIVLIVITGLDREDVLAIKSQLFLLYYVIE